MKIKYLSTKEFKISLFFVLAIYLMGFLTSCKKDEEDPNASATVQFKVQASNNVQIKAVVSQVGTDQTSNYTVQGTSWQSQPQIINTSLGAVHLSSTAKGVDANSELIVSIFVNGKKMAADTAKGIDMIAKTMVDLRP